MRVLTMRQLKFINILLLLLLLVLLNWNIRIIVLNKSKKKLIKFNLLKIYNKAFLVNFAFFLLLLPTVYNCIVVVIVAAQVTNKVIFFLLFVWNVFYFSNLNVFAFLSFCCDSFNYSSLWMSVEILINCVLY